MKDSTSLMLTDDFIFPVLEFQRDLQYRLVQNFSNTNLELQNQNLYQFKEEAFFLLQQAIFQAEQANFQQKLGIEVQQLVQQSQLLQAQLQLFKCLPDQIYKLFQINMLCAESYLFQQQVTNWIQLDPFIDTQAIENFDNGIIPHLYSEGMDKKFNLLIQDWATYQLSSISVAHIFKTMPDFAEFLYEALQSFLKTLWMFFFFFSIYDLQDVSFFFFFIIQSYNFFFFINLL